MTPAMIVDQHRAIHDSARISSGQRLALLTREEWELLQDYRACSPTEQRSIFRALCADNVAAQNLTQRGGDDVATRSLVRRK